MLRFRGISEETRERRTLFVIRVYAQPDMFHGSASRVLITQDRYITSRFLPDKAIDLMDEACAIARVQVDSKPEIMDRLERLIFQLGTVASASVVHIIRVWVSMEIAFLFATLPYHP